MQIPSEKQNIHRENTVSMILRMQRFKNKNYSCL